MKTYRAIVQPLEPSCPTCMDGTMPGEQAGRRGFALPVVVTCRWR